MINYQPYTHYTRRNSGGKGWSKSDILWQSFSVMAKYMKPFSRISSGNSVKKVWGKLCLGKKMFLSLSLCDSPLFSRNYLVNLQQCFCLENLYAQRSCQFGWCQYQLTPSFIKSPKLPQNHPHKKKDFPVLELVKITLLQRGSPTWSKLNTWNIIKGSNTRRCIVKQRVARQ